MIYLKSQNIPGDVTAKGYENCVKIKKCAFEGIENPAHVSVGNKLDRTINIPTFSHITLIKLLDKSSPKWFEFAHSSSIIPSVEIHYVTSGDSPQTYAKTVLKNVMVTHYSEDYDTSNGDSEETICLSYTSIQRTYTPRDTKNQLSSPLITGFDLETAQKM